MEGIYKKEICKFWFGDNILNYRYCYKSNTYLLNFINNESKIVGIVLLCTCSASLCANVTNKNNNVLKNKPYIDEKNNITLNINDLSNIDMTSLDADVKIVDSVNMPYPFKKDENIKFAIPDDLTEYENYIVYIKKDKDSKEYDVVANYIILVTNGKNKNIEIKYSKDREPIRDYYFDEKSTKTTTINDINLKIYKAGRSFYTTFKFNDYNFDIETSNITEQEFSNYLVSILK